MEKKKSKSKSKSKSKDNSKSKESKKSSKKSKKTKEKIEIQDTSSAEINKLVDPQSPKRSSMGINNFNNINSLFNNSQSPKSDMQRHLEQFNNINNIPKNIKCDGCFENDAKIFCEECNKCYCQKCDEQLHIIPSYRNHNKNSLNFINNNINVDINNINNENNLIFPLSSKTCFLHTNEPIQYFCESCEEPICQKCQMIGPHNNKLHKIVSIVDSFQSKFTYINKIANKQLVNIYKQMLHQLKYLEKLANEIKRNKNKIEREIRAEYSKHFENLNSICGKKFAVINFESNNLQKDLNNLTEIMNYINEITNNESPDMIGFLLKFNQLKNMIENLLNKPINSNVEINMDDFPKDVEEQQIMINVYEQMEKLSKYKDEIIWRLLLDKNSKNSSYEEVKNNYDEDDYKINEKAKLEIQKWAKISDKYASELQKYYLVCQFCGCVLDESNVNNTCDKNMGKQENNNGINEEVSSKMIKNDIYGNKWHYFIKPKDNLNKLNKTNNLEKNIFLDENISSDK